MGAAEKLEDALVGLKPEIKLEGDKVIVSYPKEAYLDMAKEKGIEKKTIDQVKTFDNDFNKAIVVATGDALVTGYKEHKEALGHTMEYKTPLSTISISGKKSEYSVLSGTHNIGLRTNIKRDVPGLKATIAAKKKEIFGIINPS